MTDQINALDDAAAVRILNILVRRHPEGAETGLTADTRAVLQETYGATPASERPSEGDLARLALRLLAEEPETREGLAALIAGPIPERFDIGLSVGITVAVLFALQTRVRFERDGHGKIKWLVEKKPTDAALLKPLIQKLLAYLP